MSIPKKEIFLVIFKKKFMNNLYNTLFISNDFEYFVKTYKYFKT